MSTGVNGSLTAVSTVPVGKELIRPLNYWRTLMTCTIYDSEARLVWTKWNVLTNIHSRALQNALHYFTRELNVRVSVYGYWPKADRSQRYRHNRDRFGVHYWLAAVDGVELYCGAEPNLYLHRIVFRVQCEL